MSKLKVNAENLIKLLKTLNLNSYNVPEALENDDSNELSGLGSLSTILNNDDKTVNERISDAKDDIETNAASTYFTSSYIADNYITNISAAQISSSILSSIGDNYITNISAAQISAQISSALLSSIANNYITNVSASQISGAILSSIGDNYITNISAEQISSSILENIASSYIPNASAAQISAQISSALLSSIANNYITNVSASQISSYILSTVDYAFIDGKIQDKYTYLSATERITGDIHTITATIIPTIANSTGDGYFSSSYIADNYITNVSAAQISSNILSTVDYAFIDKKIQDKYTYLSSTESITDDIHTITATLVPSITNNIASTYFTSSYIADNCITNVSAAQISSDILSSIDYAFIDGKIQGKYTYLSAAQHITGDIHTITATLVPSITNNIASTYFTSSYIANNYITNTSAAQISSNVLASIDYAFIDGKIQDKYTYLSSTESITGDIHTITAALVPSIANDVAKISGENETDISWFSLASSLTKANLASNSVVLNGPVIVSAGIDFNTVHFNDILNRYVPTLKIDVDKLGENKIKSIEMIVQVPRFANFKVSGSNQVIDASYTFKIIPCTNRYSNTNGAAFPATQFLSFNIDSLNTTDENLSVVEVDSETPILSSILEAPKVEEPNISVDGFRNLIFDVKLIRLKDITKNGTTTNISRILITQLGYTNDPYNYIEKL